MDKNKLIGYSLIGLVFIGFTLMSRPSQEEIENRKRWNAYNDSFHAVQIERERVQAMKHEAELQAIKADTTRMFFNARNEEGQVITLRNNLVAIDINTRGGMPQKVELLQYQDYRNKEKNVVLFNNVGQPAYDKDFMLNLILDGKNENLTSSDVTFTPVELTDSTAKLRMMSNDGSAWIDLDYRLYEDAYMVDFKISSHGMSEFFPSSKNTIDLQWKMRLRQQEKGFAFENRYAGVNYKEKGEGTDNLSETVSDSEELQGKLDWVAYKNQFFSCMMIAPQDFSNANLSSTLFVTPEAGDKNLHYLKRCEASMKAAFDPSGKAPTQFIFYFGPNDYHLLKKHNDLPLCDKDLDMEDLVPMGWPLFRWINSLIIRPLFDLLHGWGLHMGLVILLLTVIIKALVYPATKKSFLASARMRVLKPKIDEINAKYPNKEDALRKQQEVMGLYKQYGVSPMGGCLPMLIQMPIWIALFNFVPNAIQMRGQSFLWADDLSAYDELLHWGSNVPMIGDHLSIFCLLFCATNIINTLISMRQQQNNALSADQQQSMKLMKWMMYIMPLMFFFMFNNYASGLCYYYFLSGLTSILIMWYLRRSTDDKKLLAELERRYKERKEKGIGQGGGMTGGLNNMAARLQELQKRQEEERRKKLKK